MFCKKMVRMYLLLKRCVRCGLRTAAMIITVIIMIMIVIIVLVSILIVIVTFIIIMIVVVIVIGHFRDCWNTVGNLIEALRPTMLSQASDEREFCRSL